MLHDVDVISQDTHPQESMDDFFDRVAENLTRRGASGWRLVSTDTLRPKDAYTQIWMFWQQD